MCGYCPCGEMEKTLDLRSERRFPMWEYRKYGKPFKRRLQRKKMPKIDLYPDSKSLIYPPIQGKENRLPQRPINSAIGTGGLDFLIACALLILCHSLFKVVIDDIAEGRKLVIALSAVYTIIHRNKVNIMFGKHDLRIHADLQIITSET